MVFSLGLFIPGSTAAMTDPMQPPGQRGMSTKQAKPAQEPWRLTSTLIGEHRRLATINNKTLRIGDSINGARLLDIQQATVTIYYQNRRIKLSLLPSSVKRLRKTRME